ncbi:MAG: flavin reductase [Planctomycetota bacterium]|nr:flavin reductase [Planctomycetota bacterium]
MDPTNSVAQSVEQIPSGMFLVTAAHDGRRSGVLSRWVQRCSDRPNMITIAMPKGLPVEPLIRDSRCFALCQISADDVLLQRKFAQVPERSDDPFESMAVDTAPSGSPIVKRAMSYLDCELVSHLEFESEFRLYVGLVHHAEVLHHTAPAIYYGTNGFSA